MSISNKILSVGMYCSAPISWPQDYTNNLVHPLRIMYLHCMELKLLVLQQNPLFYLDGEQLGGFWCGNQLCYLCLFHIKSNIFCASLHFNQLNLMS